MPGINAPDDLEHVLAALRDFFAASSADARLASYKRLARHSCSVSEKPYGDPNEVEYCFNRLFVGPGSLIAPPYASAYLDPERRMMGCGAEEARAIYRRMGVRAPGPGTTPEDHVALELDALVALASRRAQGDPEADELWSDLVDGHMAQWLPRFVEQICRASSVAPSIRAVASLLEKTLCNHAITRQYSQ